ncbi:MAG: hypothetical protein IJ560_01595 [Alphaproteobacteria bacterium]|nr:hypothetical protein [Alphaproteobacteria bacterium]
MQKNCLLFSGRCSLATLCLVSCSLYPWSCDAAVRVGNLSRSYAESYNAVAQQRAYANAQNANNVSAAAELPVTVANAQLAEQIINGENDAARENLEKCSRIYPDGEFEWAVPTAGRGAGGAATCVAVVNMYGYQMGPGGTDANVARVKIAAGDTIKCNISEFPDGSYLPMASEIIFPADSAPTKDDVERVMNAEQKQNAGLKIAAASVVAAVGGNVVGKNDPGKDGLFGTSKGKMQSTLIGGLGGAALMATSIYSGKVAGDTILSAGVNAVAGGVIGNMSGIGDSVLRIENCQDLKGAQTKCLWGALIKGAQYNPSENKKAFINISDESIVECKYNTTNNKFTECAPISLIHVVINANQDKEFSKLKSGNKDFIASISTEYRYELNEKEMSSVSTGEYVEISSAQIPTEHIAAMITGVSDSFFGVKASQWDSELKAKFKPSDIVGRDAKGMAISLKNTKKDQTSTDSQETEYTLDDFYPMTVDAEDGALIDFSNRARMKSTAIGAGAGGTIGAFIGYQGAVNDIEERWVTALREYQDSRQKVYCMTGKRYLSQYNDMLTIPDMQ